MTVSILQSNYIPWKGYFDIIAKSDIFVIYDEVQYTKNDWRNRNQIISKQGVQWITIPVKQDSLDQRIDKTQVFLENWNKKHKNTLVANYSKAPYFKEISELLFTLYEKPSKYLSDINLSFILSICNYLDIKTEIINSKNLYLTGDRNERLIDACTKLNASNYLSGPGAKDYLNLSLFESNGINVEWMDYSNYRPYNQGTKEFVHSVSIIDLLFKEGKASRGFLKN
jgi:hypothetical protein